MQISCPETGISAITQSHENPDNLSPSKPAELIAMPRFYCNANLAQGAAIALPDNAAHHAVRVLRMQAGDAVTLFNGDGTNYAGEILRVNKTEVVAKIIGAQAINYESPLDVTLAQAISSGERMDYTLQKSVELGINRIQPLAAERCVVKLSGDKIERRREHWQNVVIAACEQSGRTIVPQVLPPMPYMEWLGKREARGLKLMLTPTASQSLSDVAKPEGCVCLLIGCEGGFSPSEQHAAESCGFTGIKLGARVLRTETAALAALAAMQALWGDF